MSTEMTCPECGKETTPTKRNGAVRAVCKGCGAIEVLCPENWPDLPEEPWFADDATGSMSEERQAEWNRRNP